MTLSEALERAEKRYWTRLVRDHPGYGYRRLSRLAGCSQAHVHDRLRELNLPKPEAPTLVAPIASD